MTDKPQTATVSDEAVQAALDEYYPAFTPSESAHDDMRRALTAALPHLILSAAPCFVEVRKLEWEIPFPHETQERAESIFGTYAIWEIGGSGYYRTPNATSGTPAQGDQTVAKAADQADFERRILSQIVTKPVDVSAVRRQAFEEAVDALKHVKQGFESTEYATPQPIGSFSERLACDASIDAIRALSAEPTSEGGE